VHANMNLRCNLDAQVCSPATRSCILASETPLNGDGANNNSSLSTSSSNMNSKDGGSSLSVLQNFNKVPTVGAEPYKVCLAAWKAAESCGQDASELRRARCNALGVGSLPGVNCFQSRKFRCAADGAGALWYTCRRAAVVADKVQQAIDGAFSNITAAATAAVTAAAQAAANGSTVNNLTLLSEVKQTISSSMQPLLQPLWQDLAGVVGNVSQRVLNISLPNATTHRQQYGWPPQQQQQQHWKAAGSGLTASTVTLRNAAGMTQVTALQNFALVSGRSRLHGFIRLY